MNSTTPDLAAIRARHAASTPGTWITTADIDDPHSPWGLEIICVGDYDDPDARLNHIVRVPDHDDRPADLCFIADAHQDIPALLDMIERLQTQRRQNRQRRWWKSSAPNTAATKCASGATKPAQPAHGGECNEKIISHCN